MKNYISFSFIAILLLYSISLTLFIVSQVKIITGIGFLGMMLSFIIFRYFIKKYTNKNNVEIDHKQSSLIKSLGIDRKELTRKMKIVEQQLNDYSQKNHCPPNPSIISEALYMHLNEAEILSIATYQIEDALKVMIIDKISNQTSVKSIKDLKDEHYKK